MPEEVRIKLAQFVAGEVDYFVLRNMPTDNDIEPTPSQIRARTRPSLALSQLVGMAMLIGRPINEGPAHTIRFHMDSSGIAEEETWHAHPYSEASMFFCMRGDSNVKTRMLSAREVYDSASDATRANLQTKFQYVEGLEPFALIESDGKKLKFSTHLFDVSSAIQAQIQDLHLPDMRKMIGGLLQASSKDYPQNGLLHILAALENAAEISYVPGDFAVYDEGATVRYSPAFPVTKTPAESRWLKAIGVGHDEFTSTPNAICIEHDLPAFIARCSAHQR